MAEISKNKERNNILKVESKNLNSEKLVREQHIVKIEQFKKEYRKIYDHGYHVVQKLDTEEKIENFVKLWRTHFIKTMKPKYMPYGWSIDFRIKTKI